MKNVLRGILLLSALLVSAHSGMTQNKQYSPLSKSGFEMKAFLIFKRRILSEHVSSKLLRISNYQVFLRKSSHEQKKHDFNRFLLEARSIVGSLSVLNVEITQELKLSPIQKQKLLLLVKIAHADVKQLIKEIEIFLKGHKIAPRYVQNKKFTVGCHQTGDSLNRFEQLEIKIGYVNLEAAKIVINLLEQAIYSGRQLHDLKDLAEEAIEKLVDILPKINSLIASFLKLTELTQQQKKILITSAQLLKSEILDFTTTINQIFFANEPQKTYDKPKVLQSVKAI